MAERFTRLYMLPTKQNYLNQVQIIAGSLLKDNTNEKRIVQLKFKNIAGRRLEQVKVEIKGLLVDGNLAGEPILYTFDELNLQPDEEGGQKAPVYLQNKEASLFSVKIVEAIFEEELPELEEEEPELSELPELVEPTGSAEVEFANVETKSDQSTKKLNKKVFAIVAALVGVLAIVAVVFGNGGNKAEKGIAGATSQGEESSSVDAQQIIALMKNVMPDSMDNSHPTFWEEDGDIYLSLYTDGVAAGIPMIRLGISSAVDAWEEATDAWRGLSGAMADTLSTLGYDGHMILQILNDEDTSKVIYAAMDGVEIYNVVTEDSDSKASNTGNTNKTTSNLTGSKSTFSNSSNAGTAATSGEKNAVQKAKDYLAFTAFSHDGLVDQLEYEGFTYSEAKYGADHCGADWNEQAAKKAQQYLDFQSFSRSELMKSIVFSPW